MENMLDCCRDYSTTDARQFQILECMKIKQEMFQLLDRTQSKGGLVEKSLINMLEF